MVLSIRGGGFDSSDPRPIPLASGGRLEYFEERAELADPHGFTHLETMSAVRLPEYLLTQSNMIAAVEQGTTPREEVAC